MGSNEGHYVAGLIRRIGARSTALLCTLALLLGALGVAPAHAEDESPLRRASRLNQEADEHWRKGTHSTAAAKLREAAAIYEVLEPVPTTELAATLRKLVWNQARAKTPDAIHDTIHRLLILVKQDASTQNEVASAWGGCWEAVSGMKDKALVRVFMGKIRDQFVGANQDALAAQVAHSWGSRMRALGETDEAIEHLETAIAERAQIEDKLGLTWSLNNLANLYLEHSEEPVKGLAPLLRAYDVMHTGGSMGPQYAVRFNVDLVEPMAAKLSPEDRRRHAPALLAFWQGLLKITATTEEARVISSGWAARAVLREAAHPAHAEALQEICKQVQAIKMRGTPAAEQRDTDLRGVRAHLERLEGAEEVSIEDLDAAATMLKGATEVSETSPVAPHLRARTLLLEARLAALRGDGAKHQPLGAAALAAWESLEDYAGLSACLETLAAATLKLSPETPVQLWVDAHEARQLNEAPEGAGGSAMSSGDRTRAGKLSTDAPLFVLDVKDGVIHLADLAARVENQFPVTWTARRVAMNGLYLQFFGGYITVLSLNYGAATRAGAAPGTLTLDQAGDYVPLPPPGRVLIIQKDGGVRYGDA